MQFYFCIDLQREKGNVKNRHNHHRPNIQYNRALEKEGVRNLGHGEDGRTRTEWRILGSRIGSKVELLPHQLQSGRCSTANTEELISRLFMGL